MASLLNVNMTDLVTLERKGVLRYVNSLYNPGGYFDTVHIATRNPADLKLDLDGSLKVHQVFDARNSLINLFLGVESMVQLVEKENIDIIRGRGLFQSGWQAVEVGRRTKRPVVVSCGSDYQYVHRTTRSYELKSKFLTDRTEEYVLRKADRVFVYDQFLKRYCISRGTPEENIRIVPVYTDTALFNPLHNGREIRIKLGIGDDPMVLYVGNMTKAKQTDSVARAVPLVLQQEPQARFVFVGEGPLRTPLGLELNRYGKNVLFLGYQQQDVVADLMAAATVAFVPFSVFVILEAAASAKPIVAYDIEWHSEFVEDGFTGRLIENRNEEKAAEAIVELIRNLNLAHALGKNAFEKVTREFNERDCIKREIAAYEELLH